MEDGLRGRCNRRKETKRFVLILVLMEDGLRVIISLKIVVLFTVLILVLMEDGLRGKSLINEMSQNVS